MLLINEDLQLKGQWKVQWNPKLPLMMYDGFAERSSLLLANQLHRSSHFPFIATGGWVQSSDFLYTPYAAIVTDSITCSINIGITSIRKYVMSMRKGWNSTAIKHMRKRLKPGPFSSASSSDLRMRLSSQKQTLMNIAERVRSAGLYLITGLDCRPEYWTGLMEWITGSTFQLNLLISLVV